MPIRWALRAAPARGYTRAVDDVSSSSMAHAYATWLRALCAVCLREHVLFVLAPADRLPCALCSVVLRVRPFVSSVLYAP